MADPEGYVGLFQKLDPTKWPIVYSPNYNLSFWGLEKLHSFDSKKWGRIHDFLKEKGLVADGSTLEPKEAEKKHLLLVHEEPYLNALATNRTYVAGILELAPVALLPMSTIDKHVLRPFRFHTGGTVLAAKLAMDRGWAINIGGGFHHCRNNQGGGFCVYADITMAIRALRQHKLAQKTMIVDLDAHQGNGHERDFKDDKDVYILDVYNADIYPNDKWAKTAIDKKVEVHCGIKDDEYLRLVKTNLEEALKEFKPDFVLYNAGTDMMAKDPLGQMDVSPEGVIKRDELVFEEVVKKRKIPILMVTSGGYQWSTAEVIANSIINLYNKQLITPPSGFTELKPQAPPESGSSGGWFSWLSGGSSTKEKKSSTGATPNTTSTLEDAAPPKDAKGACGGTAPPDDGQGHTDPKL